jgi:hypothetical protein
MYYLIIFLKPENTACAKSDTYSKHERQGALHTAPNRFDGVP